MSTKKTTLCIIFVISLILVACTEKDSEIPEPTQAESAAGIANPASVYCEGLGFELELRTTEAGTTGICIFPDGSECDEWDFLAGRCGQEHSYCLQQGNVLQENGNIGTCVFPDGSSCLEIDFFEGRCGQ